MSIRSRRIHFSPHLRKDEHYLKARKLQREEDGLRKHSRGKVGIPLVLRKYKLDKSLKDGDTVPSSDALEQYADYLLADYLRDYSPYKSSKTEYPIVSERSQETYMSRTHPANDAVINSASSDVAVYDVFEGYNVYLDDPSLYDVHLAIELAGLSPRQRDAIELLYFEEMYQDEAAEHLGVTQQRISTLHREALAKLRAVYEKFEEYELY